MLACAFVAGLSDTVRQLLRVGSRMDELPLAHILTRARAVLTDEVGVAAAVSAMTIIGADASVKRAGVTSGLLCFQCNRPNHLARDGLLRRKGRGDSYGGRGRGAGRGSARCYRCDGLGHFASSSAGATKVEKHVSAGATKLDKPVCAGATEVEKPVCAGGDAIEINEPDFCVSFDASEKAWSVTLKWSDGAEPHALRNRVTEYSIPTSAILSYEAEIEEWVTNGSLEPYDDKKLGPAKGLIPLMAIVQLVREPMKHEIQVGNWVRVVSEQTMEVDGMPRHVLDLRSAVPPETAPTTAQTFMGDDDELPLLPARRGSEEESSYIEEEVDHPMPRRSGREKRFPDRYGL